MKNYNFNFTLNDNEYIEFLKFQLNGLKSTNRKKLWFTVSLPAIVAGAVFVFKLYEKWLYLTFAIFIIILWIIMAPVLWNSIINRRINNKTLSSLKLKGFTSTNITADNNGFIINSNGNTSKVLFSNINFDAVLQNIIIIAYNNKDMFIIPNCVFETTEKRTEFLSWLKNNLPKKMEYVCK